MIPGADSVIDDDEAAGKAGEHEGGAWTWTRRRLQRAAERLPERANESRFVSGGDQEYL
jgi:hypothetical protein